MKYEDSIMMCLNYIECNIKEELNIEDIAYKAGYSMYHFSRIFKEEMGVSLMEYVKERRLICASREIYEGKKIIDVAIEYGYQTHSGFTKAFKKKFNFTPALIHVMRMSCEFLNENGGNVMGETTNIFIKQSEDFIEPEVLYKELIESIKERGLFEDLTAIEKAYHMAIRVHQNEYRKSGEAYIIHPLCVAKILAEIEADEECIIAGLLHEIREKDTMITLEEVAEVFSEEVAGLIAGVTLFNQEQVDVKEADKRVILIKLADRLHNMRTIKYMEPEKLKEKAKETLAIFSPIAARLGIEKIKDELNDLAVKYL